MNSDTNKGAALPLVLFFVLFAFLTSSIYLVAQIKIRRPALRKANTLQALLNARSGIWVGLQQINKFNYPQKDEADTTVETDDVFANDLFDDSSMSFVHENELIPGSGQPAIISPYSDPSFGLCSLSLKIKGRFMQLFSTGIYRTKRQSINVFLGSYPLTSTDTVLYLEVAGMPQGGSVEGKAYFIPTSVQGRKSPFEINPDRLQLFKSQLNESMIEALDTAIMDKWITIRSREEFERLADIVNGSLIIEDVFGEFEITGNRELIVLGDLQIGGDTKIRRVDFKVGGEIRILDNAELFEVRLYSQSRIFFADRSIFYGDAVARGDIEIYNNAVIKSKSSIVGFGTAEPPEGEKGAFGVHIRDQALVDAVVIDVNRKRGIETEAGTEVTGVLWAKGKICHEGAMAGAMRAQVLVNTNSPGELKKNVLKGYIKPLYNITDYPLPYFIGDTKVITWNE